MNLENVTTPAPPEPEVELDQRYEPPRHAVSEWMVVALLLLFGTTTLLQAFVIPTGSMEDTLLIGDHLLVDKLAYAPAGNIMHYLLPYRDPQRGDIIVFRYPIDIRQNFVKRVIGIPGDHIRIENKQVIRNGVRIQEPYKFHKTEYFDPYRDNFPGQPYLYLQERAMEMLEKNVVNGELIVPANSYFAMGDNRDNSLDSRYWGFVPRENIIGKPLLVYWSYETTTSRLTGSIVSIDHAVDLVEHFLSRTRWNRTFKFIHGNPSQN